MSGASVPPSDEGGGEEDEVQWIVTLAEPAEVDLDAAHAHLSQWLSEERVASWARGLEEALDRLAQFGPRLYAVDEEHTRRRGREVRRMLYLGPTRKPLRVGYHILYTHTLPAESWDAGVIRILRILHASRGPDFGSTAEGA